MTAVVERWKEREGLAWIAEHPHRQYLIRAAAKLISEREEAPDPGELRFLLETAEGWTRGAAWAAAKQHWQIELVDLLADELVKPGLDVGLRRTLIEIAGLNGKSSDGSVAAIVDVVHQATAERQLELVYDVMRTPIHSDGRGEAGDAARRARAERVCDALDETDGEIGRLLMACMSGEENKTSVQTISGAAETRLESILETTPHDVTGALLCAAAAIGIETLGTARRLLGSGDADDGIAAVKTLLIDGREDARSLLRDALTHEQYRVRRDALDAVIRERDRADRELVLAAASDPSADIRLCWASLMQEYRWPEAIGPLVGLLGDERNFSSDYGYVGGPFWPEFLVARAAAHALEAYESLSKNAVDALLKATSNESPDLFVACAAISALVDKDDSRIPNAMNDALKSNGLKGAPKYRPLAQVAAWSLYDRAVAGKTVQFSDDAIRFAVEDLPVIAGPLLMAAGTLGGEAREMLLSQLASRDLTTRTELVRVAAIVAGVGAGLVLGGCELLLKKLADGMTVNELGQEERAAVEAWTRGLDPKRDVQRYTAWVVNAAFELPLTEEVGSPRALDLPKRIGLLTLRSLTPAREEFTGLGSGL